ncbi:CLUMA_CG002168, isoform A [Clunio marinus]|uniref:CLUMA_CG002168, isoform A n=1 Tax=Clunio marinus TaxID=568069 RepID=A0A1J1HK22_9DIPT|nr:CLUMA_CG002168, isoform A [Clunio marinus]
MSKKMENVLKRCEIVRRRLMVRGGIRRTVQDNQPKSVAETLRESIFNSCLDKDYNKSMKLISQYEKESVEYSSQMKIIKAICMIFLDIHREEIMTILRNVIGRDPDDSFALYATGLFYYMQCELEKACDYFRSAIGKNCNEPLNQAQHYLNNTETILESIKNAKHQSECGQYHNAFSHIKQATEVDIDNGKLQHKLTMMSHHYKDFLEISLEANNGENSTKIFKKVESLILAHDMPHAKKYLKVLSEGRSKNGEYFYLNALFNYKNGELMEAKDSLLKCVKLSFSDPKVIALKQKIEQYNDLLKSVALNMKANQYKEAVDILTNAISIDKYNHPLNQMIYLQRSLAYAALNDMANCNLNRVLFAQEPQF